MSHIIPALAQLLADEYTSQTPDGDRFRVVADSRRLDLGSHRPKLRRGAIGGCDITELRSAEPGDEDPGPLSCITRIHTRVAGMLVFRIGRRRQRNLFPLSGLENVAQGRGTRGPDASANRPGGA